jgi:hypothetical protein
MRKLITLLTTAAIVACADDPHPTAPASRGKSDAADLRPTTQTGSPQSKPVDQVGFTKITTTSMPPVDVFGPNGEASATCPAGTTAVGGGYELSNYDPATVPPRVIYNRLNGSNGWMVKFWNGAPGWGSFTVEAFVTCLS